MSGRLARTTPRTNRPAATPAAALAALLGLATGLTALAQPPEPKAEPTKPAKPADPNSPVPADGRRAPAYKKYAMPNPDRAIFTKIEDYKPVASEEENPGEYAAWCEFVVQARRFPAAELEQVGLRQLTVVDLLKDHLKPAKQSFRTELIRFDGKLACVRRLEAPRYFTDNADSEVRVLYEARIVPVDDSPLNPVSVVFLDLPEPLAAVRDRPFKEWADADAWVTAAGYYFKTMSVPGDRGNVGVPVLVARGVTPLPGPPAPPGDDPTAIDPDVLIYRSIRDDTKMVGDNTPWEEIAAFNRVILHANRFTAEELERHATPGVTFADLFFDGRQAYKLKNVKFEGRLISLKRVQVNDALRAAKVDSLYAGWVVPKDEPRGNPVCVYFTDLPEGVEVPGGPSGRINLWVSFAGYSFKLMRYESAERHEDESKGFKVKKAPLLVARALTARPDPDRATPYTWSAFFEVAVGGVGLLLAAVVGLALWFRRGDRKSMASVEAARGRNPFEPGGPPA